MDVVVKTSSIDGQGVFAARDFRKGEAVIKWADCSKALSADEVARLPDSEKKYVSWSESTGWVLFGPPGKFVNHSCDANTRAEGGCDVAVRDIREGEEITADYIAEKVPLPRMKCNCGSGNCRRFIGGQ